MTFPYTPRFRARPATLVGRRTTVYDRIEWDADDSRVAAVLTVWAYGEARYFGCNRLDEVAPHLWEGEFQNGIQFTIRPTVESDAIGSPTLTSAPQVPLPVPVMGALVASEGVFNMPNLYAMSEDDGFVATMMLNADTGLYVRASSAWHLLTDEDVVDGLNVVEVTDAALDMFDQFDRAGQLVHISAMQRLDGLAGDEAPLGRGPEAESTLVAAVDTAVAAETKDVPTLASADDLPAAIEAAMADPDMRWWVERRMRALGLEAELPWHDDA